MGNALYTLGEAPTVFISNCSGELQIEGRGDENVVLSSDSMPSSSQQAGRLVIENCEDDLRIQVPMGATVRVEHVEGELRAHRLSALEVGSVDGDVELGDITGRSVVRHAEGEARVRDVMEFLFGTVNGDLELASVRGRCRVDTVEGEVRVQDVADLEIRTVNGDLKAGPSNGRYRVETVEGDAKVREVTELSLGTVNGDLALSGVRGRCSVRQTEGDARIREVMDLSLGGVNGDLDLEGIAGRLSLGRIEGDVRLRGNMRGFNARRVEGDLTLEIGFVPGEVYRLEVGGDATVNLPSGSDVALDATVEGDVSGNGLQYMHDGNKVRAVWGSGAARLELRVDGNLSVRGTGARVWGGFDFIEQDAARVDAPPPPPTPVPAPAAQPAAVREMPAAAGTGAPLDDLVVLEAVARGELSPEEADTLLTAKSVST